MEGVRLDKTHMKRTAETSSRLLLAAGIVATVTLACNALASSPEGPDATSDEVRLDVTYYYLPG